MVKLRRIGLAESHIFGLKGLTLEAKKDLEDLKAYLGDDLFDSYMKIRDRIPKDQNEYKDFSKLKKMDKKDIQDFVNNFKSKSDKKKSDKSEGAEKIYSDSGWDVYRITTYPAAQLYGKGTKWCITGRYPGHEGRGEEYFNDYIRDNNLDGGYYFFIDKSDPSRKYCALRFAKGGIHSIWEPSDASLSDIPLKEVPEDLPYDFTYKGNNIGEEIDEYIRGEAGSNYDPEEGLIQALRDGDSESIERYVDSLGEMDESTLDNIYDNLNADIYVDGFSYMLDNFDPPSLSYIDNTVITQECFMAIVNKVINDEYLPYRERYAKKLLLEIVNSYGINNMDYDVAKDSNTIIELIKLCPDYVFGDISFDDVVTGLGFNVLNDPKFISLCLKKGLDIRTFFDGISVIDDSTKCMKLVRSAVDAGLKLNDKDVYHNGETNFEYILANLSPTVEDVKWLLNKGADPYIKDSDGDAAIEYSADPKIRELLK